MSSSTLINISCPECKTSFEIDALLLGPEGRYVACSECNHQWLQSPFAMPLSPDTIADTQQLSTSLQDIPHIIIEQEEILEEKVSFFTRQLFLIPVFLSLIFTGLFFGRNDVVRFVPGMERFYSTLGIPAYNIAAFRFHATQWQMIDTGTHRSIEITGNVTNTSDKLLIPPHIQISLRGKGVCQPSSWINQLLDSDAGGDKTCVIGKWMTTLKEGRLFSGQTCPFKVTYPLTATQLPTEVLLKFVNRN